MYSSICTWQYPASMHCPAGDDAFVSSWEWIYSVKELEVCNNICVKLCRHTVLQGPTWQCSMQRCRPHSLIRPHVSRQVGASSVHGRSKPEHTASNTDLSVCKQLHWLQQTSELTVLNIILDIRKWHGSFCILSQALFSFLSTLKK